MRTACVWLTVLLVLPLFAACASAPKPEPEEDSAAQDPTSTPGGHVPAAGPGTEFVPAGGPMPGKSAPKSDLDESVEIVLQGEGKKSKFTWKKWGISAYISALSSFKTEVRIDSKKLPVLGTRLSLEDDLGFDTKAFLYTISGFYNFSRRHKLEAMYFDINRTSTAETKEEIRWGEFVLPPTKIELEFRTQIFKLNYVYNFVARDDWEMGIGTGIHWMQLNVGYKIETRPTDADPKTYSNSEELSQALPLPLLLLHGAFKISEDWLVTADIGWLGASIMGIKGSILDARLGIAWRFADWIEVGLEYNVFILDVEASNDDWRGEVRYSYNGFLLGVGIAF